MWASVTATHTGACKSRHRKKQHHIQAERCTIVDGGVVVTPVPSMALMIPTEGPCHHRGLGIVLTVQIHDAAERLIVLLPFT
mmetsp:Transcript_95478/g.247268  ORF Transcript_95478/g.247268 Transcript_95478/m.247268 type:complete len:82 (+) Transcript_95478:90-335(+)